MAGFWAMIRLILRRDRVKVPLSILGLVATLLMMYPMVHEVYRDDMSLQAMFHSFSISPALRFVTGPMDAPTIGSFFMMETLLWWGLAIAFLNTLLIVRHTRYNEEIGVQELLLSGKVRRSSSLAAVLTVAALVNILIVLGIVIGFSVSNVAWGIEQSWLYALVIGVFGLVWAAIAAIVVQLVESSRVANGILAGLIGMCFVIRGIGDFLGVIDANGLHQPEWMSTLVPFGWLQATRPLTEAEWSPIFILLSFTGVAIAIAFMLLMRRDIGEGLLPSRTGRKRALRLWTTPLGLTMYLQGKVFFAWGISIIVVSFIIGILAPQMSDIYADSGEMYQIIQAIGGIGELIPAFMSAMMAVMSMIVFGYGIHGLTKLRSEELSGKLENLLATRVTRLEWLGCHIGSILVGGSLMLMASGFIMATCVAMTSEFNVNVWQYTLAGLSYVPALLVFISLYVVLFGWLPRAAGIVTWSYYGFTFFVLWIGPMVRLDSMIMNISIMEHIAASPSESIAWRSIVYISGVAIMLILLGCILFRRRDIQ